jgi:hypothetical protein
VDTDGGDANGGGAGAIGLAGFFYGFEGVGEERAPNGWRKYAAPPPRDPTYPAASFYGLDLTPPPASERPPPSVGACSS